MSTRSTSRRIRSAAVLPPPVAPEPVRPRSGLSLARHIIAHEIRSVEWLLFFFVAIGLGLTLRTVLL